MMPAAWAGNWGWLWQRLVQEGVGPAEIPELTVEQAEATLRKWPERKGEIEADGDNPKTLSITDAGLIIEQRKRSRDEWVAGVMRRLNRA